MAATIMILSWTGFHMSFDKNFENYKNIYRVVQHIPFENDVTWAISQGPLGESLTNEIPGIDNYCRIMETQFALVPDEVTEYRESLLLADPAFLEIFTIDIVNKSTENLLESKDEILISQSLAYKFFGDDNPVGKTIGLPANLELTVTGVFKDLPESAHLQFDALVNLYVAEVFNITIDRWNNSAYYTYVQLNPEADPKQVKEQIAQYLDTKPTLEEGTRLDLQELVSIHRTTGIDFENAPVVSALYIRLFLIVGIFILILASINYINLDTAKASKRSKEIGIRKISGAKSGLLIRQFMGEALVLSFVAILLALILVALSKPLFHQMTGIDVRLDLNRGITYLKLGILWLVTGFLSGAYPALILSKLKPISILKSSGKGSHSKSKLRTSLVVFQFCLAIVFIIGTLSIYRQVNHMKSSDLGYDADEIVYFQANADLISSYDSFREQLLNNPGIESVCRSARNLGNMVNFSNSLWHWPGQNPEKQSLFRCVNIGYDFFETHKMELVEGRFPSRQMVTDTVQSIVINEAAAKVMNLPQTSGTQVRLGDTNYFNILGVVKNFHFKSLHLEIEPQILILNPSPSQLISCRLSGVNNKASMDHINQTIQDINQGNQTTISYLKETLDAAYRDNIVTGRLLILFTSLAILVSMLGLIGLMAFVSEQRIPEIGIRKTLGASNRAILRLFSIQYIRLIAFAIVISWPLSFIGINQYLKNFPYRINMPYQDFIIAGIIALILVQSTLFFVSIKTARKAAVACLRHG